MLSGAIAGKRRHQHGRNDREILRDIVGDAERGQRAARDQHLFPDLNDVEQLGRIAVEIDHVAGFARGLRAGVHRDADIGLRERGRVVRPVTGHGDEMTVGLFVANALEFLFRRRLRHEIVHAGLSRDGRGGQRIVAGDHHRLDSHLAQVREALLDSAFDDVFELDRAERHHVRGDDQRSAAAMGNFIDRLRDRLRETFRRLIRQIRAPLRPRLCARAWSAGCRWREDRHRSCAFAR